MWRCSAQVVTKTKWVVLFATCVAGAGAFRSCAYLAPLDDGQTQTEAAQIFVRHSLDLSMTRFWKDMARYPSTAEGLGVMFERPTVDASRWKGPYLPEFPLRDPWGQPYQYAYPGRGGAAPYALWSLGPDPVDPADDIGNW